MSTCHKCEMIRALECFRSINDDNQTINQVLKLVLNPLPTETCVRAIIKPTATGGTDNGCMGCGDTQGPSLFIKKAGKVGGTDQRRCRLSSVFLTRF